MMGKFIWLDEAERLEVLGWAQIHEGHSAIADAYMGLCGGCHATDYPEADADKRIRFGTGAQTKHLMTELWRASLHAIRARDTIGHFILLGLKTGELK